MPAKSTAATPKKVTKNRTKATSSRQENEALAMKVYAIREQQRREGNFDCFGKAASGFCDQSGCVYHPECIDVSRAVIS